MESVIDKYIDQQLERVQPRLREIKQLILEVDPTLEEALSYRMPTFKKHGRNVFHFAAQLGFLGVYPTPAPIAHFAERLKPYKTSKGAIHIPYDRPLDKQLIQDIVRYNLRLEGPRLL